MMVMMMRMMMMMMTMMMGQKACSVMGLMMIIELVNGH
jgi:hypothetical protein